MDRDIIEYLKGERSCVVAVEMMDGSPHASTVHFATAEDPFCFIFETDKTYRKSEPLFGRESSRASLVVGTVEGKTETFQLDGVVALTTNDEHKKAYLAKFPEKEEKAKGENVIFFTFTPTVEVYLSGPRKGRRYAPANMNNTLIPAILISLILALILGAGIGYLFGYDHGAEPVTKALVDSFEDCAAAGYPVMESYPEQCRTPDGELFIRDIPEVDETDTTPISPPLPEQPVACTMDARICPDGSAVGRMGPHCEFAPCPGE